MGNSFYRNNVREKVVYGRCSVLLRVLKCAEKLFNVAKKQNIFPVATKHLSGLAPVVTMILLRTRLSIRSLPECHCYCRRGFSGTRCWSPVSASDWPRTLATTWRTLSRSFRNAL